MAEKKPTIQESISRIHDQIILAKSEGDTKRLKLLEKILEALERKKREGKQ